MKIEGLMVPIKNPAGFLFQKLEFDCKRMIMRGKKSTGTWNPSAAQAPWELPFLLCRNTED